MFIICCILSNVFMLVHGNTDSLGTFAYKLDQAALEIMRGYDSAEEARQRMVEVAQDTRGRQEITFHRALPIQTLKMNHPVDMVKIMIETSTNNKEHLLAISNHYKSQFDLASTVDIYKFDKSSERFNKIHSFIEMGPFELEYLTIQHLGKTKHLLAIAGNSKIQKSTSITTRVVIYELFFMNDKFGFREFQNFGSVSVDSIKSVTRHNITFLVFGMRLDQSLTASHAKAPAQILVLIYNQKLGAFQFHSTIPANIISDIEMFDVENMLIMTIACYKDDKDGLVLKSPVYKLNDNTNIFELYQTIETRGARDIEYFQITKGHFIVIANEASGTITQKQFGVPSTVYQFIAGKYHHVQNIETYGAVRWKSTTVPNCQNSVLLFYGDQARSVNQVGFYMYSQDTRKFSKIPITFYDNVDKSFRPRPNTLLPFMIGLEIYVAIGADDISAGHTLFKIQYSTIDSRSPWEKFESDIQDKLRYLSENITFLEQAISQLEEDMKKLVYIDTKQNITGVKVFSHSINSRSLDFELVDVSDGSIHFEQDKTLYRGDPNKFTFENLTRLEVNASDQAEAIASVGNSMTKYKKIDEKTDVVNNLTFSCVCLKSEEVSVNNVEISSCRINQIDICDISRDIVRQNGTDIIFGTKTFLHHQKVKGDLDIGGRINGIDISTQVVTIQKDEIIASSKSFASKTIFEHVNLVGNVNGINISKEAISVTKNEVIYGLKTFKESLYAKNIFVNGLLDGVDVDKLAADRMTLTSDQNVTGRKVFESGVSSIGDINVFGSINGFDLDKWKEVTVDLNLTNFKFTENIEFHGRVIIEGNITVEGRFNNLSFPDDVVLIFSKQNIMGLKVFSHEVRVKNNIDVLGLVDNVNMTDVVLLSSDDIIHGSKTFHGDVQFLENINVAASTLVNEEDISKLRETVMTKHGSQEITGLSEFLTFETKEDIEINRLLDDRPIQFYEQLLKDSVLLEGDQIIHGRKSFLSNISILKNITVNGLVNGHVFPNSFLDKFSNQKIHGIYNFTNLISRGNVSVNGKIDGILINQLDRDIITIDTEQEIKGVKTFNGNLNVNGNLSIGGKVNNITSSNLLTKHTVQMVATGKEFENVGVFDGLTVLANNVSVKTTVDGVDLSNFSSRIVLANRNQTLNQIIHVSELKTAGEISVGNINYVNLEQLAKEIVTLNTDQTILSEKEFTEIETRGDLITNSTVDAIDVSSLSNDVVKLYGKHNVLGTIAFQDIRVKNLEVAGLVHYTNLSELADEVILKTRDQTVLGKTIIQDSVAVKGDISIHSLNHLRLPKDLVLKNSEQTIYGKKLFTSSLIFKEDINVVGKINGINLTLLNAKAVKKNIHQVVSGKKTFLNDVQSDGDVTVSGNIDGLNLVELNRTAIRINRDQTVEGKKAFAGITEIQGSIAVEGRVNSQNITEIVNDAVTVHGTQNITGAKIFTKDIDVHKHINIDGDIISNGLINNINITKLAGEVMDLNSDQVVAGSKIFTGNVAMRSMDTNLLNGRNFTDFVTVHGNETITGRKIFVSSIKASGDVMVNGFVDGERLRNLQKDTLFKLVAWQQNVTGEKTFENQIRFNRDVQVHGNIDNVMVERQKILTLHSDQNITGTAIFNQNLLARRDLSVHGLISEVNLSKIMKNRVTLDSEQTLIGDVETVKGLISHGDILVNGTTNGIDLNDWTVKMRQFVFNTLHYGKYIDTVLREKCPVLDYIKNSVIKGSPLQLDYFKTHQRLNTGINHMEPFKIGNDTFLAVTPTHKPGTPCQPSYIMKFSKYLQKFLYYQALAASGAGKFKAFNAKGSLYLFLGNKEDGCLPKGQSPLYKWNSTSTFFDQLETFPTNIVSDISTISLRNQTVFLAIANANQLGVSHTTIWMQSRNETVFCQIQTLPTWMPSAIEMFEIGAQYYMMIAMSLDEISLSTRTMSNVYRLDNNKWMLMQQIPTAGASDVEFFTDDSRHYIVICNERTERFQTLIPKHYVETYRFLEEKNRFVLEYTIDVTFPTSVQHFMVKSKIHYISVAAKGMGLKIFQFRLHIPYKHVFSIPQTSITNHRVFTIEDDIYIAIGDANPSSQITSLEELSPRVLKAQLTGITLSSALGCV